ncbi:MAG TPA: ABC transporter permease [Phycisphaerales bacterium]|nr:ABC transporter permease [Phycisphaerales bacterium]HMP38230.1 ABC transporter permease [Phycisphaerales bacterium]
MQASWHIARSALSGRRGRSVLLAIAVALASCMVVAVACAVGSLRRSVEWRLDRLIGAVDARIIDENGNRFDADLLEEVAGWPGVEAAGARLFASITVLNGSAVDRGAERPRSNLQVRGVDLGTIDRFGQIDLVEGRLPETDEEILLDPMAFSALDARLGDTLTLQRFGAPMRFVVVGRYDRPTLGVLQRAGAAMSRRALGEATGRRGEASVISLILAEGTDIAAWCEANQPRLEGGLVLEPAELFTTGFDRQLRSSRLSFLIASIVAFLACSFIVATGMTTAVVEQQRLLAVTRCIGAARGHLFLAQLLVGASLCGLGGLAGVPLGIALAGIVVRALREYIPTGLAVEPFGIALALAGSLAAGVGGALYPAWRAARTSPLTALSAGAQEPTGGGLATCAAAGIACLLLQAALLLLPDAQHRFWAYVFGGLTLAHLGWFLLSPAALVLATRAVGPAIERIAALPRGLLVGSLLATPFRAGFTAGALMVGISILVSTWSNGRSLLEDWVGRIRFGDGFVFRLTGISADEQQRIAELPFVVGSVPMTYLPLRVVGDAALGVRGLAPPNVVCVGFDPRAFIEMTTLEWKQGSPEEAIPLMEEGDGLLVAEQFLVAHGIGVGDTIRLAGGRTEHEFRIVGVVDAAGLDIATQWFGIRNARMEHAMSCVLADIGAVRRLFGTEDALIMQLALDPSASDDEVAAAIGEVAPGSLYSSGRAIRRMIDDVGRGMLAASSAVALMALLLGCFGVGNVIAAGIHARRQEFGVLRAIGGSSWLPARLVCGEAAVMAIAGSLTGTALGMHLAWVSVILHRDLLGLPMRLIFPAGPAVAGLLVAILLALLAALPASWLLARRSPRELLAAGRG